MIKLLRKVAVVLASAVVVAGVAVLVSACTGKNKSAEQNSAAVQPIFIDRDTEAYEVISPEDAEVILSQQSEPESDSFKLYADNNQKFMDDRALCNQGSEPLKKFISRFASDTSFQRGRQKLIDNTIDVPVLTASNLTIATPDESGFFASWSAIEPDSAVFCSGWIDSEMAEELVFKRIESRWYLIDYFDSRDWME